MIDHLVYAGPDLEAATKSAELIIGVPSVEGGRHVGFGTANRLIGLGPSTYLEIIGPDPSQPTPAFERPFGIDALEAPRLVTWAVAVDDIEAARKLAGPSEIGHSVEMTRRTPTGDLLRWRLTPPVPGSMPFLIDWLDTPHPAGQLEQIAKLVDLRIEDTDPAEVRRVIRALKLDVSTRKAWEPRIAATIDLPDRRVVLW